MVPSQASANLNIRLLPGNSIQDVIEQMQKAVNDPQVKFTVQPDAGPSAPSSSITTELYQTIERLAPQQFPGAVVVPYLIHRGPPIPLICDFTTYSRTDWFPFL